MPIHKPAPMILISACLTGRPCRYDGRRAPIPDLWSMLNGRPWLGVCPEQLGGLSTPRSPARLVNGDGADVLAGRARVIDNQDRDVTSAFIQGAEMVLHIARRIDAETCFLKDRSPSCGVRPVMDAEGLYRGRGVCAALLAASGIRIVEVTAQSTAS